MNKRGLHISLALFACLGGLYFLLFRGLPISTDELALFSMTESLAKHGRVLSASAFNETELGDLKLYEPLHIVAAAPLFRLAIHLPNIGLLHFTWLLNLIVGASIGVLLYWAGIQRGYSDKASAATALIMGTGTLILPYSLTFFREPLASLWVLLATLLVLRLRDRWQWGVVLALIVVGAAALATKLATLAVFPVLGGLIITAPRHSRQQKLWMGGGLIIAMLLITALLSIAGGRFSVVNYLDRAAYSSTRYFLNVVAAYWISPGRSIFATNPVLLLAIYGSLLLYRSGRRSEALFPWIVLLLVACAYGLGGYDWHGGRGWGMRYQVPIVPIFGLLLFPVLETVLQGKISRFWVILGGLLVVYSTLLQIAGTLMPLDTFYGTLSQKFPADPINAFYNLGTWQVQHTQWFITLTHFDPGKINSAWDVTSTAWIGIIASLVMMAVGGISLWRTLHGADRLRWQSGLVAAGVGVGIIAGLVSIYKDERTLGDNQDLWALLDTFELHEGTNDVLYLAIPDKSSFFLNYYKGQTVWYTLPYPSGERYSFEQVPANPSTIPDERMGRWVRDLLAQETPHYHSAWVLEGQGPFHYWAYRPTEHYLTRHFYPLETLEITPNLRLIHFDTHRAPAIVREVQAHIYTLRYTQPMPELEPFIFGDDLYLTSSLVPDQVIAGEVLPVSLRWMVRQSLPLDYNIGVFVVNAEGLPIAQRNSPPQNTFGNTQQWQPGVSEIDHHGVVIPAGTPPGAYQVQVVVYDWRTVERLPVAYQGEPVPEDAATITTIEVIAP